MIKRGDIFYANLDPTIGSQIKKTRPVIVVSNNANNKAANTITVVPLTSNIKKVYPFETLLESKNTNLSKDSKTQCHQIRTISKLRISGKAVGCVQAKTLEKINLALKLHLDLNTNYNDSLS